MTKDEKLILLQSLLRTLVYLPYNSGISTEDATAIYDTVSKLDTEEQVDACISIVAGTLENIGFKLKSLNEKTSRLQLSEKEDNENRNDTNVLNTLISHF